MPHSALDGAALRLAAIVESSDDAIISQDLQGRVTSWNRAAERMFGFSAHEMIGERLLPIVPQERRRELDATLQRIRRGETVAHFETLRARKDGTLVPISQTVSPICAADGTITGVSTIARDISERRRIEAALAEADAQQADMRQRLAALVSASSALLESPRVGDVLPRLIDVAREVVGADAYALWRFEPGARAWFITAYDGISRSYAQERVSVGPDGPSMAPFPDPMAVEDFGVEPFLSVRGEAFHREGIRAMLAVPLKLEGAVWATLACYYRAPHRFSDVERHVARALSNLAAAAITTAELYDDQRRSRERAERERVRATFLADASARLASSLDYTRTLRSLAALTVPQIADWCAVDIINQHGALERLATAHVDPSKIEALRQLQERYPDDPSTPGSIAHVAHSGVPVLAEQITDEMMIAVSRDADHLAAVRALGLTSYMSVPLIAHGRTLGALSFATAESGRRYTDEDLRFAADVAYRAALAVDNARAYEQANAASRAKDEFLATLSHELRTPLNAVLGWMRMLRAGGVRPERVAHALEVVERNASAQLRLVEDLLDLSRIITGKFRLEVQPVDLPAVIDAAVESVQPAATAKDIRVHVLIAPEAAPVQGDPARLQQAVWNLLSNAIKFTPRGGRVQLAVRPGDSHVEIDVADTGAGIRRDVLPFVFDRFRQGDSGPSRGYAGLGLGLAIVRHIVELHGGTVSADSEGEGRGATFRITLPLTVPRTGVPPEVAAEAAAPREDLHVAVRLDGCRVLVVEDDGDARELVAELLAARGAEVTAVGSAAEALATIDDAAFDVIVSDLEMPGQDGFAFIRALRLRAPDRGGAIPAVALTAYARPQDRARSLVAGFQMHLAKPVDADELIATVASVGGRART